MKVAIVTGSNKGIGYETAKKIAQSGVKTILACRSMENAHVAENELRLLGLNVECRRLDISDPASIGSFVAEFRRDYLRLDILVNNAGIALKSDDPTPLYEQAKSTIGTNVFGTLHLTKALLSTLRKSESPRIVNVASEMGHLSMLKSDSLRDQFTPDTLSMNDLEHLMNSYIQDVKRGTYKDTGWPDSTYCVSKIGVIAMTKILARQEAAECPKMKINACCPGYCDTDMTSHKGPRSAEEGARTSAMLALTLSNDSTVTGKFYANEVEIEW